MWGNCGQVNGGSIEVFQWRAARIVMTTYDGYSAMVNQKWPTLTARRNKHILNLVNKCIKAYCHRILINI